MLKDKHAVINGLDYSEYISSPEWRAKATSEKSQKQEQA